MEELKKIKEIANYFKVTPKTINIWKDEKGMPFLRLPSGAIRFKTTEVIKWSEGREDK